MRRSFFLLASSLVALGGASLFVIACTDNGTTPQDETTADASTDSTRSTPPSGDAGGARDADASLCEVSEAYYVGCKQDLNCGPKYAAWCATNDQAINSDAYRNAELTCLTQANCDPDRRADCEYKSLSAGDGTAAQKQLVTAYCQTCEPGDTTGCATRSTTYDSVGGPKTVTDIFVAAWEFNDAITSEMRTACTGAALDAGADAGDGGCAKAFAGCTADVYLSHLPDCPK